MKIRFYANDKNEKALSASFALERVARSLGLETASFEEADVVIALGGDGTILRAVRLHRQAAVLGFNLGGLGYLAAVGQSDFENALKMLSRGEYKISTRTLIEANKAGRIEEKAIALNEISILREMTGHAAILELSVDSKHVARYMADGVLVATPTGSTAYTLAAGGPVIMPDSASFAITPVNPHALAVRPLVVSDSVEINITSSRKVNGYAETLGVYSDGESVFKLGLDETLQIRKAADKAKFIELEGFNPYEVLGRKLGWS